MRCLKFLSVFFLFGFFPVSAELFIAPESLTIEPQNGLVNTTMKIYLKTYNSSSQDLRAIVKFYDETEQKYIGQDQSIVVVAGKEDHIFQEFIPQKIGEHKVSARIIPWQEEGDNPENNKITKSFFVDQDTDGDGIGNVQDGDDDNDGVEDTDDTFPLDVREWADSDGDGQGNNADSDDDNDGIADVEDAFPLDASESVDLDQDGIGDNADTDDDGDGLSDDVEPTLGTDPRNEDTDGDRVRDGDDDYPLDPEKQFDTDKDGIDDSKDDDDDNDGVKDGQDLFPKDGGESHDFDQDGVGDNADGDDDNDGLPDEREGELQTDPFNVDTDGDGHRDGDDALPLDASEFLDSDHDGLGDNADPNDDNQGPFVEITRSAQRVKKGELVTFDAGRSYDPEGGRLEYLWKLPDGTERSQARIEYAFQRSGKRSLQLILTDEEGESRSEIISVDVERSPWERSIWIFILLLLFLSFYMAGNTKREQPSTEGKEEK